MYVLEDSIEMTDLADAIRAKTGSAGDLTVADMITEVGGISGSITYVKTQSSNAGTNTNNTIITLPSELQGGSKDFFVCVKHSNSSGYLNGIRLYFYSHSNNTFTVILGGTTSSAPSWSSFAWNNSSTKTQIQVTTSSNTYWKADNTDYNHVAFIY